MREGLEGVEMEGGEGCEGGVGAGIGGSFQIAMRYTGWSGFADAVVLRRT
jgi:hypothetical protein